MPYKSKCFSTCRGIPEDKCKTRRCSYVNGSKLAYCRISKLYKLNKKTCKMVSKFKKTKEGKTNAVRVIQQTYRKYKKGIPNTIVLSNNRAANKIQRFFKKTTLKRQTRFLNTICPNSGSCLAFGKETVKIYNFFHGFIETDYIHGKMKKIGKESTNGFIFEIGYKKNNYNAYAILKSSQTESADNLAYEYMVGQFVNRMIVKYPCFLETYGLYQYKSDDTWTDLRYKHIATKNLFDDSLELIQTSGYYDNYKDICTNAKYMAILIQHIKDPSGGTKSMDDLLRHTRFIVNDCIYAYYQIYFVLSALRNNYTHYDLHNDNIMLYKPDNNGYIEYHYELNDGTVTSFYSQYIAKIIDYGRCYFNDIGEMSSKDVQKELCKRENSSECITKCGDDVGFTFIPPVNSKELQENYFMNNSVSNISHDLRALYESRDGMPFGLLDSDSDSDSETDDLELKTGSFLKDLYKIKYGAGITKKDYKRFGTIENKTMGYPRDNSINNVKDAETWLRGIIKTPSVEQHNQQFYSVSNGKFKIGDMYVYESKADCKFLPFKLINS